jgi:tRNA A-37 threonylcarbamoyl transferase component Bud32
VWDKVAAHRKQPLSVRTVHLDTRMSDHGSDEDDLPDISYVRGNITNVQTSRFTVVTAQNGPQKDVLASPFSAVGLELAPLKTTNDFILMLDRLHVPGPLTILEALDSRHYIAKGGQFTVYRNEVLDDSDCSERTWLDRVAVKRCDFEHEENRTLDLSSPRYRIQVQNMQREVAALQDIRLKNHPNIVKLIGYGIDLRSWHETPFLVMPLALGDLRNILEVEKPPEVVHQMCLDVGYGLDAIHDCGLIHGDLKPENVLVFATEDESIPLIAKLADFGLSMDEISGSHGGSVLISGYSPGWAAPEVSRCYSEQSPVSIEDLMRFDCFSYGLVILSSACFHGQVPPSVAAYSTPSALKSTLSTVPSPFRQILGTALSALLHCNEAACPSRVGGLLIDETPACLIW